MSNKISENIRNATNILGLVGLIAGGVFFFTDVNKTNALQDERDANLQRDINTLRTHVDDTDSVLIQQGKDVAIIKYYFDNGVLRRLQLEDLKKKAVQEITLAP